MTRPPQPRGGLVTDRGSAAGSPLFARALVAGRVWTVRRLCALDRGCEADAAVDHERLPGDPRGVGGGQERHRRCDVIGFAQSP